MSKELDRLFKEKLADRQVLPSEAAWDKVEASLDKQKKGIVWFRAAAAIVLLCGLVITILLVRSGEDKKTSTIAKVDSARVAPQPKVTPAPKKKFKTDEPKLPMVKSPSRKMKVYIAQTETNEVKEQPKNETEQPIQQLPEVAVVTESQQAVAQLEQPAIKPVKAPITLTYTLAPIPGQEKNLASAERKGLQKMVDAAIEAKNSEGALAELRILKDDLFAFNFKKK